MKKLLISFVALSALLVVGCGSSEEPESSAPPAGSSAAPAGAMNAPAQAAPNSGPAGAQMK